MHCLLCLVINARVIKLSTTEFVCTISWGPRNRFRLSEGH